jgi:hypothetical protein
MNAVFWDVDLLRTDISEERMVTRIAMLWSLGTANVPSSPILVTLMMEAICSSETLVLR